MNSRVAQHRQNFEALQANADLTAAFVARADDILFPGHTVAFTGYPDGRWNQKFGPIAPLYSDAAQRAAGVLLEDIITLQYRHALATGQSIGDAEKTYDFTQFVATHDKSADGSPLQLRWFGVTGLRGGPTPTNTDNYRLDWWQPGEEKIKTIFTLSCLGGVAVAAECWTIPDERDLARRCFSAFLDKAAVDMLLTGDFRNEAEMEQLLERVPAGPEHAGLHDELRRTAHNVYRSSHLMQDLNLIAPNRDQLAEAVRKLRIH